MIGIDTNLLVRVFARDDARQGLSASRLIDQSGPGQLFVNVVVLVGFADKLIAAINRDAGCDVTLTFDKGAAGSDGLKELET